MRRIIMLVGFLFWSVSVVFAEIEGVKYDLPKNRTGGLVDQFMPTEEGIPRWVFEGDYRQRFTYVGSLFDSQRYGVGRALVAQDTYAQVWAIKGSRWELQFPRWDFLSPGTDCGVPVKDGVTMGFALSIRPRRW